jgi:hypothetical protein
MKDIKAPSLFVSGLFLIAALAGYFLMGPEQTGALITGALSLAGMIWRLWQEQTAPADEPKAMDREPGRSFLYRVFWA